MFFRYTAIDRAGKVATGELVCDDKQDATLRLKQMGLTPVKLDPAASRKLNIPKRDVLAFTQELHELVGAGIQVDQALELIGKSSDNTRFTGIVRDMTEQVRSGKTLTEMLRQYPDVFGDLYVGMVEAGEMAGALDQVLEKLAAYLESGQELRSYIVSSMVYPVILGCVSLLSILLLVLFVIPQFETIFEGMNQSLPWATQALLDSSRWLGDNGLLIVIVCGVLAGGAVRWLQADANKRKLAQQELQLPFWGEVRQSMEVAQISRILSVMLASGVPLLKSLEVLGRSVAHPIYRSIITFTYDRVHSGERFTAALREAGGFPSIALQIYEVGEATGNLARSAEKVAGRYERSARESVKRLVSLLEPLLIIGSGLFVGGIIIAMLLAIFSINDLSI